MKRTREELLEFYGLKDGDIILVTFPIEKNWTQSFWFKVDGIELIHLDNDLRVDFSYDPKGIIDLIDDGVTYTRKEEMTREGDQRCDATLCEKCPLNMLHHAYNCKKQEQPTLYEVLEEVFKGSPKTEDNQEVYKLLKSKLDRYI